MKSGRGGGKKKRKGRNALIEPLKPSPSYIIWSTDPRGRTERDSIEEEGGGGEKKEGETIFSMAVGGKKEVRVFSVRKKGGGPALRGFFLY